ncbi:hypothetical protein KOI35_30475 [Actinoplanes bogorensis]|uniref:DUF4383 domain-containing protein n=1 Tax=Paractinoplanes bogorensis TaxID=1610840 RepID=A0ABS5YX00_9ACTN|nr:hypothetical protein [Actinoplanes bogorensis]MBU2667846.1 hypothetical protein [Actinoplanes bogorensis]
MRKTYRILAYVVAAEVVVQAIAIAWFVAGLGNWVTGGGVLDNAAIESDDMAFPELYGLIVHGINGSIVVPVIALALLIVAFFAKIPGGIKWAVIVLVLTVLQGQLGYLGHDYPAAGGVHGLNALALFTVALVAARRAPAREPRPAEAATVGNG